MNVVTKIISLLLLTSLVLGDEKPIEEGLLDGVTKEDVTFQLYTKENPDNYIPLVVGNLHEVSIDAKKPFKFIIHGYTSNSTKPWVIKMKNKFLDKGNYNVVGVNWSRPAKIIYFISVGYVKDVGNFVAELIRDLKAVKEVPYENIHLIGHSLGAHVSGFAGKRLLETEMVTFGRITGLDPAGPLFSGKSDKYRLSPKDAHFVDVIHTDGSVFGYMDTLGNADFYPNGGTALQPGCSLRKEYTVFYVNYNPQKVISYDDEGNPYPQGIVDDLVEYASCSHSRSIELFTESIKSESFIAEECSSLSEYKDGACNNNSCAVMGENIEIPTDGIYYLTTNGKPLYAREGQI